MSRPAQCQLFMGRPAWEPSRALLVLGVPEVARLVVRPGWWLFTHVEDRRDLRVYGLAGHWLSLLGLVPSVGVKTSMEPECSLVIENRRRAGEANHWCYLPERCRIRHCICQDLRLQSPCRCGRRTTAARRSLLISLPLTWWTGLGAYCGGPVACRSVWNLCGPPPGRGHPCPSMEMLGSASAEQLW